MDIDTPLYDVAMNNLSYPATWHLNEGFEPRRVARSGHPSLVPSELYRTADGWIFVMANKANFWPALCRAMERPEWIDDPLMRDFAARYENRDEVVRRLEAVFLTRTTEAWLERLGGVLPCAPVNDVAGALASGFAAERRIVQEVEHPRAARCAWCASPSPWTAPSCPAAQPPPSAPTPPPSSPSSATNQTRSRRSKPTARSTATTPRSAQPWPVPNGNHLINKRLRHRWPCRS